MHGGHTVSALAAALSLLVAACAGDPMDMSAGGEDRPAVGEIDQAATVCAGGTTLKGIDVSTYQGTIDWNAVKNAGVVFAIIRVSHGTGIADDTFAYNWAHARQAGVVRGAYHFFQPDQDVAAQANKFIQLMGPLEPGDLPPVLDVEATGGLGPSQVAQRVNQWLSIVEPAIGRKPIIYTGKYFWQDNVGSADDTANPLWVAQWGVTCPDLPSPWTRWSFHQTSDNGHVAGIGPVVDTDVFNGTLDQLVAMGAAPECGDGVCSGGETSDSCIDDCPPCQIIGADGDVVDDGGACFTAGGDPKFIRHENAGYGSALEWTHTTDFDQVSNFGRWDLYLAEAGRYELEAYTPAPYGMSKLAVYQLKHAGQTTAIEVDQTAVDGWQSLGEFDFAAGGSQSLELDDNTGESEATSTMLVFDAIRLTRVDRHSGGDGEGGGDNGTEVTPAGGSLSAGCSAGGGAGGTAGVWLLLLGLALAPRARRRRAARY